jgi:hypothetical protein
MSAQLEQGITDYSQRRTNLVAGISAFAEWLDRFHGMNPERNLQMTDLAAALHKDRLMVAFVAEYSRGKTELINALFFADLGQRLLPSDIGRTTMCPTEISYEEDLEPSLRLLPIETRLQSDPLGNLKLSAVEWSTIRLDPDDPQEMQATLQKLTESRKVTKSEAEALGLYNPGDSANALHEDADGMIEIPAWRYAMINYPHPLLKAGLCILDTPGLNALGAEPELTLASIPNAHAVFFLLATDTGVTRSDLEIWQNYVHRHSNFHIAVLNKIDTLWDDLRGEVGFRAALNKQLAETARILKLPEDQVFAVSAQKALIGKVRDDSEMVRRSGIAGLESLLAEKVVPARREILFHGAIIQMADRVGNERANLAARMRERAQNLQQLAALSGKGREMAAQLHASLSKDKVRYDAAMEQFNVTSKVVQEHGEQLLERLSENALRAMLEEAHIIMDEKWTTKGLIRAMHGLTEGAIQRFGHAEKLSFAMQQYLLSACERFHREHGLPRMSIPVLDLTAYRLRMDGLMDETRRFCSDPGNLIVEKHFMIRRFFNDVAAETRRTYSLSAKEAKRWLGIALDPVTQRIQEYKQTLDDRLESMRKIVDNVGGVQGQMVQVKADIDKLRRQKVELEDIAKRFESLNV